MKIPLGCFRPFDHYGDINSSDYLGLPVGIDALVRLNAWVLIPGHKIQLWEI